MSFDFLLIIKDEILVLLQNFVLGKLSVVLLLESEQLFVFEDGLDEEVIVVFIFGFFCEMVIYIVLIKPVSIRDKSVS
jgi:hypothetical protein